MTKCRCGEKSWRSWSSSAFFLLFPAIFANSYPVIPPSYKSVPYWSPCSSLPPPVFLASAGTLPPAARSLALSLSPILSLPYSLSTGDHALHFPLILCFCPFFRLSTNHSVASSSTASSHFRMPARQKKVYQLKRRVSLFLLKKKRRRVRPKKMTAEEKSVRTGRAFCGVRGQSAACLFLRLPRSVTGGEASA